MPSQGVAGFELFRFPPPSLALARPITVVGMQATGSTSDQVTWTESVRDKETLDTTITGMANRT
jgi:hypothetical protein